MNLRHSEITEIYQVLKYGRYNDYEKKKEIIEKFEDYLIRFALKTKDPVLRLGSGSMDSLRKAKEV